MNRSLDKNNLAAGFPANDKFVDFVTKEAIDRLTGLCKGLFGDNNRVILQGCVATQADNITTITEGYLYYNGEILYHAGSTVNTMFPYLIMLRIVPTTIPGVFGDGMSYPAYIDKAVSFGTAPYPILPIVFFNTFVRIKSLLEPVPFIKYQITQQTQVVVGDYTSNVDTDLVVTIDAFNNVAIRGRIKIARPAGAPLTSALIVDLTMNGQHPEVCPKDETEGSFNMSGIVSQTEATKSNSSQSEQMIRVWIRPQGDIRFTAGVQTETEDTNYVIPICITYNNK